MNRSAAGAAGESTAVDFLKKKKYRILRRNYRFGRGEIDIVAEDGKVIVFVEVKVRSSGSFGAPEDAISGMKQRALRSAAQGYIYQYQCEDRECRFDIVAIDTSGAALVIRHMEDAF